MKTIAQTHVIAGIEIESYTTYCEGTAAEVYNFGKLRQMIWDKHGKNLSAGFEKEGVRAYRPPEDPSKWEADRLEDQYFARRKLLVGRYKSRDGGNGT